MTAAISPTTGGWPSPSTRSAGRLAEVPEGELWVYCRSGYRSFVAASFLEAAGRTVVAIDDDYGHAATAGLPVTGSAAAASQAERGRGTTVRSES